jgi:CRISPR-associated endonuclease Cas2
MDPGLWWPDGDASRGKIPLSALEHAGYCLRQAALIHVDGVFADDARTVSGTLAHQNVQKSVFEIVINNAQLVRFEHELRQEIDAGKDSIRMYRVPSQSLARALHLGIAQPVNHHNDHIL